MLYRSLGKTGMQVSVISLGCVPLGGLRLEEGMRLVKRAVELGINYIDTARGYRDAELTIGQALKGERERVYISTKTGARTRDEARQSIEESLQRLQTDYVDNCHIHGARDSQDLDQRLGPGGALEALIEAREQGKVKHIGITGHKSSTLLDALSRFAFETIMVPMNLVERQPLEALIPYCQRQGVGVTIMKPVATGLLPGPLALKWLVNQPIATAAAGMTTLEELEMNAAVGMLQDVALTTEEQGQVAALKEHWEHLRCRICRDCDPCPVNIPIGIALGTDIMYDHYRTMGHETFAAFPWAVAAMERDLQTKETLKAGIKACNRCGVCEPRCPYSLPIMEMLQQMLPAVEDIIGIYRQRLGNA